jgi:hypothetical protein
LEEEDEDEEITISYIQNSKFTSGRIPQDTPGMADFLLGIEEYMVANMQFLGFPFE